jgi:type II secretory pathway pseudopilin PulG
MVIMDTGMGKNWQTREHERGFTYLWILLAVSILGASLGAAAESWATAQRREKERQLLFVGNEYRQAIGRYYEATPGPAKRFPPTLEALLKDPRHPGTMRHLRKLYLDPISGKDEWGLVEGVGGGIAGVYSLSEERPLKVANFSGDDRDFEGREKYAEWIFAYQPKQLPVVPPKKP